jgi:hypothetical protein
MPVPREFKGSASSWYQYAKSTEYGYRKWVPLRRGPSRPGAFEYTAAHPQATAERLFGRQRRTAHDVGRRRKVPAGIFRPYKIQRLQSAGKAGSRCTTG